MSPESLDDFPAAFAKADPMPWEDSAEPICWPFGPRSGEPLTAFSSRALVRMRGEVEKRNGKGSYFLPLIIAIDRVLFDREGL